MSHKILVVGSLNVDLVARTPRIPVPGETITGFQYLEMPGGKGANQAFACARLGGRVAMIGRVGADNFGNRLVNNLDSAGCEMDGIVIDESTHTGLALIIVSEDGQNAIVLVPGANARLLPEHLEQCREHFAQAETVLLQLESPLETVMTAVRMAREAGARVILDPAPARQLPEVLLRSIDILTPNESEAALLTGRDPGSMDVGNVDQVAEEILRLGPHAVILKLGARGVLLLTREYGKAVYLAAPAVTAVDTTAAGDVFNAAIAVGLSEGMDLEEACRFANQAAAISVTRLGAQASVPSRAEVMEWQTAHLRQQG